MQASRCADVSSCANAASEAQSSAAIVKTRNICSFLSEYRYCFLIAEQSHSDKPRFEHALQGEIMQDIKARWLAFYAEHLEQACTQIFAYVERMIVATLIISAGAHVSSNEPAIVLFGYLRHSLVGRGIELFGIILLALNFLDGFYKLSKLDWHAAYQIAMSLCYFVLSVRLVQLILAFRRE